MPKGPQGQKRPADVIGAAVMVARIATGEDGETYVGAGRDKKARMHGPSRGTAPALNTERRSGDAQPTLEKRQND